MAAKRKQFKDSPAMQFLTRPAEDIPDISEETPVPDALRPLAVPRVPVTQSAGETRSRRVQLLMQPSLHNSLKAIAQSRGESLNELVHAVLEAYASMENQE